MSSDDRWARALDGPSVEPICLCPATSEYDPPCPRHGVKAIGVTPCDHEDMGPLPPADRGGTGALGSVDHAELRRLLQARPEESTLDAARRLFSLRAALGLDWERLPETRELRRILAPQDGESTTRAARRLTDEVSRARCLNRVADDSLRSDQAPEPGLRTHGRLTIYLAATSDVDDCRRLARAVEVGAIVLSSDGTVYPHATVDQDAAESTLGWIVAAAGQPGGCVGRAEIAQPAQPIGVAGVALETEANPEPQPGEAWEDTGDGEQVRVLSRLSLDRFHVEVLRGVSYCSEPGARTERYIEAPRWRKVAP